MVSVEGLRRGKYRIIMRCPGGARHTENQPTPTLLSCGEGCGLRGRGIPWGVRGKRLGRAEGGWAQLSMQKTLGLFVAFVRGFCPAFQDWPCMFQLQVITS